jgi:hypothetical protein
MLSRNLVSDIISHAIADVFDLKEKFTEPNIYIIINCSNKMRIGLKKEEEDLWVIYHEYSLFS